jgi:hypothetical protein
VGNWVLKSAFLTLRSVALFDCRPVSPTVSLTRVREQLWTAQSSGPYYPFGTIGTVPRVYDIFKAYEGMAEK